MWLSPPARAAKVKLSGAGWGRSRSGAAGCPLSVSPLQEHRSGRTRGWGAFHHLRHWVLACWLQWAAYKCACVNLCRVDIFGGLLLTVLANVAGSNRVSARGGLFLEWINKARAFSRAVSGQSAADCSLMGLLLFNALNLSVWNNFKAVPGEGTYLNLPVSEKNHCWLVCLRKINPTPCLHAEEPVARGSYWQTC